ncbi:unnamed protein product [Amoebophrya sp. A120]|nr:unnamed protein product [Amoebophrya sp. A120]|eukprot:GSA120T00003272001.1
MLLSDKIKRRKNCPGGTWFSRCHRFGVGHVLAGAALGTRGSDGSSFLRSSPRGAASNADLGIDADAASSARLGTDAQEGSTRGSSEYEHEDHRALGSAAANSSAGSSGLLGRRKAAAIAASSAAGAHQDGTTSARAHEEKKEPLSTGGERIFTPPSIITYAAPRPPPPSSLVAHEGTARGSCVSPPFLPEDSPLLSFHEAALRPAWSSPKSSSSSCYEQQLPPPNWATTSSPAEHDQHSHLSWTWAGLETRGGVIRRTTSTASTGIPEDDITPTQPQQLTPGSCSSSSSTARPYLTYYRPCSSTGAATPMSCTSSPGLSASSRGSPDFGLRKRTSFTTCEEEKNDFSFCGRSLQEDRPYKPDAVEEAVLLGLLPEPAEGEAAKICEELDELLLPPPAAPAADGTSCVVVDGCLLASSPAARSFRREESPPEDVRAAGEQTKMPSACLSSLPFLAKEDTEEEREEAKTVFRVLKQRLLPKCGEGFTDERPLNFFERSSCWAEVGSTQRGRGAAASPTTQLDDVELAEEVDSEDEEDPLGLWTGERETDLPQELACYICQGLFEESDEQLYEGFLGTEHTGTEDDIDTVIPPAEQEDERDEQEERWVNDAEMLVRRGIAKLHSVLAAKCRRRRPNHDPARADQAQGHARNAEVDDHLRNMNEQGRRARAVPSAKAAAMLKKLRRRLVRYSRLTARIQCSLAEIPAQLLVMSLILNGGMPNGFCDVLRILLYLVVDFYPFFWDAETVANTEEEVLSVMRRTLTLLSRVVVRAANQSAGVSTPDSREEERNSQYRFWAALREEVDLLTAQGGVRVEQLANEIQSARESLFRYLESGKVGDALGDCDLSNRLFRAEELRSCVQQPAAGGKKARSTCSSTSSSSAFDDDTTAAKRPASSISRRKDLLQRASLLVRPCNCKQSVVHLPCLEQWLAQKFPSSTGGSSASGKKCSVCKENLPQRLLNTLRDQRKRLREEIAKELQLISDDDEQGEGRRGVEEPGNSQGHPAIRARTGKNVPGFVSSNILGDQASDTEDEEDARCEQVAAELGDLIAVVGKPVRDLSTLLVTLDKVHILLLRPALWVLRFQYDRMYKQPVCLPSHICPSKKLLSRDANVVCVYISTFYFIQKYVRLLIRTGNAGEGFLRVLGLALRTELVAVALAWFLSEAIGQEREPFLSNKDDAYKKFCKGRDPTQNGPNGGLGICGTHAQATYWST